MPDKDIKYKEFPFSGKLVTSVDGTQVGENFTELQNFRYTDTGIRGIAGMTKINTTAIPTYPKIRNLFYFDKAKPVESHLMVQAYNAGLTTSQVLQNTTAIPSQGDFSATALHTDASGADRGYFSSAPDGQVAYCNSVESLLWGGDEARCAKFVVTDLSSKDYEFTVQIQNTKTDTLNTARMYEKNILLGSTLPIDGFKLYVEVANASAATMTVFYWDGSAWVAVNNLVDNTSSGGVSLAQTGMVTFDNTSSVAETNIFYGSVLYWYKIVFNVMDTTTSISQCTVSTTLQSIKDIWDGVFRAILSFQVYDNNTYNDNTLNVFEDDYSSANTATYAQLGALATGVDYIVAGFGERSAGADFTLVGGAVNTIAATVAAVYYWNGSTWASVGTISDGTAEGGISLAKSGIISWNPPDASSEFKVTIAGGLPLYHYKISFDKTLSADVKVDVISGIPAQREIGNYKFPLFANNRLFLCSDQSGDKNSMLVSASHTANVLNGEDSVILYFNDDTELTAGIGLYRQFGSTLYNIIIITKANQTWILIGNGPEEWVQYQASRVIGCVAPLSMVSAHVSFELVPGQSRYIAIWQGSCGIYMFDGANVRPIHADIRDYFDQRNSYAIKESMIKDSVGFFDTANQEYHWLFASGTSTTVLNKELVFDVEHRKWFEIIRGSGKELQAGITVKDTDGNGYLYGALNTGYIERLGNGTDFDGTDIVHTVTTGDIAPEEGSVTVLTMAKRLKLFLVAKNTTSNTISITHYGDTKTVGDSFTAAVSATDRRVLKITKGLNFGPHIFHKIKLSMTTDDETVGCEPLYLGLGYKVHGIDK